MRYSLARPGGPVNLPDTHPSAQLLLIVSSRVGQECRLPSDGQVPLIQVSAPTTEVRKHGKCESGTKIENICLHMGQCVGGRPCWGYVDESAWQYHIHEDPCPLSCGIKPSMVKTLRKRMLDTEARFILSTREKYVIFGRA